VNISDAQNNVDSAKRCPKSINYAMVTLKNCVNMNAICVILDLLHLMRNQNTGMRKIK